VISTAIHPSSGKASNPHACRLLVAGCDSSVCCVNRNCFPNSKLHQHGWGLIGGFEPLWQGIYSLSPRLIEVITPSSDQPNRTLLALSSIPMRVGVGGNWEPPVLLYRRTRLTTNKIIVHKLLIKLFLCVVRKQTINVIHYMHSLREVTER
jgi:hypothetical protein